MKINSILAIPFKSATININAFSDSHGNIEYVDRAFQDMVDKDCFEKEEKGKKNILITGGDFFISTSKKGFLTDPNKPLGLYQLDVYNKLISEIRKISPNNEAIFSIGNHELDGGEEIFKKIIDCIDSKVVSTNIDYDNSPLLKDEIKSGKIADSYITFVEDDKDPNKKYPILFLSALPFNMEYYMGKADGLSFLDNVYKSQKKVKPEEYKKSYDYIRSKIDEFKKEYPKGIVILTCHCGCNFAEDCANGGGIDLIFDAHLHQNYEKMVNKTPIFSLGQNFKRLINARLKIDDNGNLHREYKILNPTQRELKDPNAITNFYNNLFKKDYEKIYTIKSDIKELSIDGVRSGQNHLANFVVDAILSEIQKYDKDVDIFAINASSIRGGFYLKDGKNVSNLEVLNCLNGIQRKQADVFINEVNGRDLIKMIVDNLSFNSIDTEKNPIFQYSGIIVQKNKMLEDWERNSSVDNLYKYVTFEKTGENIKPDKIYKIANTEKYFMKAQNPFIKDFYKDAKPLNVNVLDLFSDYFKNNVEVEYEPKTRFC